MSLLAGLNRWKEKVKSSTASYPELEQKFTQQPQ